MEIIYIKLKLIMKIIKLEKKITPYIYYIIRHNYIMNNSN